MATDGPDGAKNLLRKIGRVGRKWQAYGPVSCIFVWDEDRDLGYAFRLKPGSSYEVEMATVPAHLLERHEREKGCSPSEIQAYFSSSMPPESTGEREALDEVVENENAVAGQDELLSPSIFPDELPGDFIYMEGLAREILVNAYERSESARNACINHHRPVCQVCRLNFEERYGEIGRDYIHVHHIVPIASIGGRYQVDPVNDLAPVCPNCHAMLHRRNPPFSIEELKARLNDG